jgi:voltage-gated potassium channel
MLTNKASQLEALTTAIGDVIKGTISLVSLFFTGIVIAMITSFFFEKVLRRFSGMEIQNVKGHTIVCGWNDIGEHIINNIIMEDPSIQIVVICKRETAPIFKQSASWINGDFTRQEVLKKGYAHQCSNAIILSDLDSVNGNQEYADWQTILAVLTIENINKNVYTTAELINPYNKEHLVHADVDEIIIRGEFSGNLMSRVASNRGLSRVVQKMLDIGEGAELYKIDCPESIKSINYYSAVEKLSKSSFSTLIGFEDDKENIIISPNKNISLEKAKYLFILSEDKPKL